MSTYDAALQTFGLLEKQYGPMLDGWFLLFFRMLAFTTTGPIFNRKTMPIMLKINIAFLLTCSLAWAITPDPQGPFATGGQYGPYILQMLINIMVGALIGFIADMVLQAIYAAGDTANSQAGLSSAMMMDPSSGKQTALLESMFNFIGILTYIQLGGLYWMINALKRSLSTFPLYTIQVPLTKVINPEYLITLSGNILLVSVELISPILVVSLAVDLMLGVVNRTAQQIPVFQLSFALKPAIGIGVLLMTLSTFIEMISHYMKDYSKIF